jgi:hypothetical protein
MLYQVIYLAEHQVVLVELEIVLNNHNRILETLVVAVRCPMDEVVVAVVHEVEVDVIIPMDQTVAIIIIIIQMITVRMAMRVMKHPHNHLHGLVLIIHVVGHSEIE